MSHTEAVTMHAAFYGGPADGGELLLAEPIRLRFRFPITAEAAEAMLAKRQSIPGGGAWINQVPAAEYRVDLDPNNSVVRDRDKRVRFVYVPPQPQPKEETDD